MNRSEICFHARETIAQREENSNKIEILSFHLKPMAIEVAAVTLRNIADQFGMPESELRRIDQWSQHARQTPDRMQRLYLNSDKQFPIISLGVLSAFDDSTPCYIKVDLIWDK